MYKANLNFEIFTKYFDNLVRKGCIIEVRVVNSRRKYKTTEKGKILLQALKKAQQLLSEA